MRATNERVNELAHEAIAKLTAPSDDARVCALRTRLAELEREATEVAAELAETGGDNGRRVLVEALAKGGAKAVREMETAIGKSAARRATLAARLELLAETIAAAEAAIVAAQEEARAASRADWDAVASNAASAAQTAADAADLARRVSAAVSALYLRAMAAPASRLVFVRRILGRDEGSDEPIFGRLEEGLNAPAAAAAVAAGRAEYVDPWRQVLADGVARTAGGAR